MRLSPFNVLKLFKDTIEVPAKRPHEDQSPAEEPRNIEPNGESCNRRDRVMGEENMKQRMNSKSVDGVAELFRRTAFAATEGLIVGFANSKIERYCRRTGTLTC